MSATKRGPLASYGLLCLLWACDSDLPSYSEVEGLRVLAVAASRPWPAPGAVTTLSALVVGDRPVQRAWSWCPRLEAASQAFACAVSEAELPANLPALDLGSAATADFTAPEVDDLCALAGQTPCEDGVEIFVRLEVTSPEASVTALRPLWIPRGRATQANPEIEAVRATWEGATTALSTSAPSALTMGAPVSLEAEAAPGAAEPTDDAPEVLTASWFVDAGALAFGRTRPSAPVANTWTLPEDLEGPAHLYVVLRDDRGGTSWRTFEVRAEAK